MKIRVCWCRLVLMENDKQTEPGTTKHSKIQHEQNSPTQITKDFQAALAEVSKPNGIPIVFLVVLHDAKQLQHGDTTIL